MWELSHKRINYLITIVFILGFSLGCTDRGDTLLERVKQDGRLVIVTRYSPTTYYYGPNGEEKGMEFELAQRFAKHLGVRLRIDKFDNYDEILARVRQGRGHIAAAGLVKTPAGERVVHYGPVYQTISQQVVYRQGGRKPTSIDQITSGKLMVMAGSAHAERLKDLKKIYPELKWEETAEFETEELMDMVAQGQIDFTIANSNEVSLTQRYYPDLRVAFDINQKDDKGVSVEMQLSWAFAKDGDDSLQRAADKFFRKLKERGELEQIRESYYGHIEDMPGHWGVASLRKHIQERLTHYKPVFQREAKKNNLDWRLLAAIGYQESLWNPKAVSPTGVRGLMMLTQATAKLMRVRNRENAKESIEGGARYFKLVKERIPTQVSDPDRTWFALAAYNVGIGHVQDAQKITREMGEDPNKWISVRKSLPLLTKKKWYVNTRYGYARGYEPVIYVRNIRRFYDLLVRYDDEEKQQAQPTTKRVSTSK